MFFQKNFILTLSLIFLLINFGCSTNIESCLEEESCGPVIKVVDFEGSLPDNPFDPFWSSGQAPVSTLVELGPQMITNPKWPNPSTTEVSIRAVKNSDEIVILLEWNDETKDGKL